MGEELYFNDELRKCLNAAGLSDCGKNGAWDYWYQRVHRAHDLAIDRITEIQRIENAKLRTLCLALYEFAYDEYPDGTELNFADCMDELGIEVN